MALFASNGTLSKDLPAPLDRVREAIESTARSEGHHIDAVSSDRLRFDIRLFTDEGVAVVRPGAARRCRGEGRGLPMMGVLTQPVRKTSTCLTLPSRALT